MPVDAPTIGREPARVLAGYRHGGRERFRLISLPLIGLLAVTVAGGCGRPAAPDDAVVRLPQGGYRAAPAREGVLAFLGIPYARPPLGAQRWREALPPEPTDGIVDASAFGPSCRQLRDENEEASLKRQDEDCLSVNVWTRRVDGPPKPVMLWIHGGANVSGGTADPMYDGHHFVRDNDVVLVSINYRLGPFGFLDLE